MYYNCDVLQLSHLHVIFGLFFLIFQTKDAGTKKSEEMCRC